MSKQKWKWEIIRMSPEEELSINAVAHSQRSFDAALIKKVTEEWNLGAPELCETRSDVDNPEVVHLNWTKEGIEQVEHIASKFLIQWGDDVRNATPDDIDWDALLDAIIDIENEIEQWHDELARLA
tara:strand:+ start:2738 stop:3115 length:378 start_codon:yes stop_codon:yes gene_type:complete